MSDLAPFAEHLLETLLAFALGVAALLAERHLGIKRRQSQQVIDSELLAGVMKRGVRAAVATLDRDRDGRVTLGDPTGLAHRVSVYAANNAPELIRRLGATSDGLRERALAEIQEWLEIDDMRAPMRRAPEAEG